MEKDADGFYTPATSVFYFESSNLLVIDRRNQQLSRTPRKYLLKLVLTLLYVKSGISEASLAAPSTDLIKSTFEVTVSQLRVWQYSTSTFTNLL